MADVSASQHTRVAILLLHWSVLVSVEILFTAEVRRFWPVVC